MTQEYPSLPEQGKNLAKFTFEVVKQALSSNALFVTPEEKKQRLEICSTCEYYDESQVRCKHCGCFLEHKANFALDSCPIDKWSVSDQNWVDSQFERVMNKVEGKEPDEDFEGPRFPMKKEIGQRYEWNGNVWEWTGELWDFVGE